MTVFPDDKVTAVTIIRVTAFKTFSPQNSRNELKREDQVGQLADSLVITSFKTHLCVNRINKTKPQGMVYVSGVQWVKNVTEYI